MLTHERNETLDCGCRIDRSGVYTHFCRRHNPDPPDSSSPLPPSDFRLPTSSHPTGKLAEELLGEKLPLRICRSAAGFYLGTVSEDGFPASRESVQYWPDRAAAMHALATGEWTQRTRP